MAVSFTIKTKSPSRGSAAQRFTDYKLASDAFKEAMEYVIGQAVINTTRKSFALSNEKKLYVAAMFFQWVVSRTPLDEEYERVYGGTHKPDNDSVRDAWFIAYGNKNFKSTDFEGCFDTFNDKSAIKKIADALREGIKTQKNIKSIRVYNTHERFSQLEYGEYEYQSRGISQGPTREHGLVDGFSIQAPKGMLRLTEAEIDWIINQSKYASGIFSNNTSSKNQDTSKAIPDKRRIKAIYNHLKNKKKLKESDIGWLK